MQHFFTWKSVLNTFQ